MLTQDNTTTNENINNKPVVFNPENTRKQFDSAFLSGETPG